MLPFVNEPVQHTLDTVRVPDVGESLLPASPPDSITRSPTPTTRSKKPWLEITVFTRSSGISVECLDNTPQRSITRWVVITKLVVTQRSERATSQHAAATIRPRHAQPNAVRGTVRASVCSSTAMLATIAATRSAIGLTRHHQCGCRSTTTVSWSFSSRRGYAIGHTVLPALDPRLRPDCRAPGAQKCRHKRVSRFSGRRGRSGGLSPGRWRSRPWRALRTYRSRSRRGRRRRGSRRTRR